MAYINKIVVNGQEVNANQLEGILDKDGHARFIEGVGTPATIEGSEITYSRWSLSGSHLMLVLAGNIESGTVVADNTSLATFSIPEWILNKIVPFRYESVMALPFNVFTTSVDSYTEFNAVLQKFTGELRINNVSGAQTVAHTGAFRLQFDLIIDNA